jgi:hypothetical protein
LRAGLGLLRATRVFLPAASGGAMACSPGFGVIIV